MPPPPKKAARAALLKLFILDAQGGYAGEYPVDEECVVEYNDILRVVPEQGLRDQQAVYLGEVMATAFHGDRMSLITVSKGALEPEDLLWVKTTLTAAEAHLAEATPAPPAPPEPAPQKPADAPPPPPQAAGPDRAALESLATALDEREKRLAERERAVAEAEERAKGAADEARKAVETELQTLKDQLAEARNQVEVESKRAEVERVVRVPTQVSPPPGNDELRAQLERDRKMLQRRALDLLDREEKLRAREMEVAGDAEYTDRVKKENEALQAELEELKKAAPPVGDLEAAKRDLDTRAKALQQRSLELMKREERLRKREEELARVAAD